MRNVFLAIIFLLFNSIAMAKGVLPEHSGAWFNPDQSGHGLTIEVISSERAIVYWYAYDPAGNPIWLHIDGQIQGDRIHGHAYYLDGMVWGVFDPLGKNMQDWGTVDIDFNGCHKATLVWDSLFPEYGAGQISLERLTSIFTRECHERKFSTTGYWEVAWSDLTTAETHTGTAIIDDSGLVTIGFPESHLIGMLIRPEQGIDMLVLDARLDLGPWTDARELSLTGISTDNGFQFKSGSDEFDFSAAPDRPNVTVTQTYLDGEWTLLSPDGGPYWHVEMVDGMFSWQGWFIDAVIYTTIQMTIPSYGGNTISIVETSVPWPNESRFGHAFYWQDAATGMEYMEIRITWGDIILFAYTMERPIP